MMAGEVVPNAGFMMHAACSRFTPMYALPSQIFQMCRWPLFHVVSPANAFDKWSKLELYLRHRVREVEN